MTKVFSVLAGGRWRKVIVSGIGEPEGTLTFIYRGKAVQIPGNIPDRYEDYQKAKTTLIVDSWIRNQESREAIKRAAGGRKITFLE